jgi:phage tail sheath protein FI
MPAALSYPGVYIQEVPSGVRTITGVATSITAFVGRAASGPICTATSHDQPPMLTSFADYERRFGGLNVAAPMSYAVRDFYLNGGTMALIVRVAHGDASAATITLTGEGSPADHLVLEASSVGDWGNRLSAAVDYDTDLAQPHTSPPSPDLLRRFNLTVRYLTQEGKENFVTESFGSVSTVQGDPRFLPLVLERDSAYVRLRGQMPASRPQSNVTQSGSKRTVNWVNADAHSGFDGSDITEQDVIGQAAAKTGIYALNRVDLFNLLCIPPLKRDTTSLPSIWTPTPTAVYTAALELCVERRAMLIVDPDPLWATPIDSAITKTMAGRNALGMTGPGARNAALYFPCVRQVDPLRDGRVDTFVPSGIIAGVMARTDVARGVWKAPAGLDASLNGVQDLQVNLNDLENGQLNPLGINCLRSMGINGRIVWGARTLRGADASADEYKYVPVRRLALFLEETLYRGTQWVVFEPNDEPLWAQVRLNVGAFMQGLFRQGAFQGAAPKDAYFVRCDSQTTTQNDINLGILNVIVGFAPLKPAEFVVISIQQMAGQIPT